jgi:CBS domain-containing protein
MRAIDVMTSPVITVDPNTTVRDIAVLLFKNRISAVPVLEDGKLVGLVSEADLLHRHEIGTDRVAPSRSWWWLRWFSPQRSPAEYIKSHARKARDIMTREVISVAPETPVAQIASLFESHGIKRVPVLRGSEVVGIVSRANLVQALVATRPAAIRVTPPSDEAIRGRLLAELERQTWWRSLLSNVTVNSGVVQFWGAIEAEDERDAARVAAENIPGVRRIEDGRMVMRDLPSMV